MKHLSLDLIDISSNPYPIHLLPVAIDIRGSKNLFNIFFKADDIENSFGTTICETTDFTWLSVGSEHQRFVSYPILKRLLYNHPHPLTNPYLEWVDGLLFSNKVKAIFHQQPPECPSEMSDTDSMCSSGSGYSFFRDTSTNDYIVASFQHKIQQLEHSLQLKDKDLDILDREICIRDEKIKLLSLQVATLTKSEWI